MPKNIKVALEGTKLIFEDGQSNVREEIYDFNSHYRNLSAFPVEEQLALLASFMKQAANSGISRKIQMKYTMMAGMIYDFLEIIPKRVSVLHIGSDYFDDFLVKAVGRFHRDNQLVLLGGYEARKVLYEDAIQIVTARFHAALHVLQKDTYQLVLYRVQNCDRNQSGGDFAQIYQSVYQLLAENSSVILYGDCLVQEEILETLQEVPGNFYDFEEDGFIIYLKPDKKTALNESYARCIAKAKKKNEELLECMRQIGNSQSVNEVALEKSLRYAIELEDYIVQHREVLHNIDAKYYCNEVKNAILDYQYEVNTKGEAREFFYHRLMQCKREWEGQIY